MADKKNLRTPDNMTFEEAMIELETVVNGLENGRIPLDQAIGSYERGAALKKRCDELLSKARLKVKEIYEARDGKIEQKESALQSVIDGN